MKFQRKPLIMAMMLGSTALANSAFAVDSTDIYIDPVFGTCNYPFHGPGPAEDGYQDYCGTGHALLGVQNAPYAGSATADFQFNARHIEPTDADYDAATAVDYNAAVDIYNTPDGAGPNNYNWQDPEYYAFSFSGDNTSDIRNYNDGVVGTADWAVTGWNHTPMYGTWTDTDCSEDLSNGDYLALDSGYYKWPSNPSGFPVGTWPDNVVSEVFGYIYTVDDVDDENGMGTYLAVDLVGVNSPVDCSGGEGGEGGEGTDPGCAYSPNAGFDMLLMLLLSCGIFYGRNVGRARG